MKRWEMGLAVGLSAAVMTAGCSGNEKANNSNGSATPGVSTPASASPNFQGPVAHPKGRCVPVGEWGSVPSNFKAEVIAQAIGGVTANQIRNGLSGPAHCTPGSTAEQLNLSAPPTIYSIKGKGDQCLALMVPEIPQAGKVYTELGMICAAQETVPLVPSEAGVAAA